MFELVYTLTKVNIFGKFIHSSNLILINYPGVRINLINVKVNMKKLLNFSCLFTVICLLQINGLLGQGVGINPSGNNADPSALLDLNASPLNNKGVLIPRLSTTQRDAITNPAIGL